MMSRVRSSRFALLGLLGVALGGGLTGCGGNARESGPAASDPNSNEARTVSSKPGEPAVERTPPTIPPGVLWVQELLNFHQQAPTITADLLIRVKAPDSDAILFQINLWCPEDGRIRLKCSKLDVDFIDALVQKNGDFVLELVRTKEVVRGNLRDVHVFDADGKVIGPPFLAYLSLLVHEAKSGPVPDRGVTKAGDGKVEAKDHVTGLTVGVEVNPDDTVKSKTFFDTPDKPTVRLDYFRYKTFDQLRRPTQLQLTVPGDASEYTVRLRELDAVPSINPDRMRFFPSQGSTEIGLEEFLKRLRD